MTKNEYANKIINDFCHANNIDRDQVNSWGRYLSMSSSLCVALEYLGLLTKEEMLYSESRGGIAKITLENGEANITSTRDLMDLLPENNDGIITLNECNVDTLICILELLNIGSFKLFANGINEVHLHIDHENKSVIIDSDVENM